MPFITECASAIKKRFGKGEQSMETLSSSKSSPDLLKSGSKDSLVSYYSSMNLARSYSEDANDDSVLKRSFQLNDDPNFWKDHNVQVIIRLRPLNSAELSVQGHSRCVKQDSAQTITWTGHPESRFTFDVVADENVSQEMLFQVSGVPMVENCVGGYNSCMFAYGQTGSGKTHTMLGDIEGGTRRHSVNCGMTPRVFEYLFTRIQKEREARREEKLRFTCKCSFLEIYNEQILDLLDPAATNLHIREDTKKGVYVENLTEVEVASARDVLQQLVQGSANRKVAATNMNRASSRSHSVFTCIIESKWESQGVTHYRFARLNLVDLAGSERQKSSGAEGERLKEATNINKSLSTLGLVIMNLVGVSNGKSQHVPYRDSKLTFLLQDSLGGNSKTIIIANISPSTCCSLETLSTLKFAQRAKFIKNHAVVNEDASGDVLAMRVQIQQLKKEVARLKSIGNGGAENYGNDAWPASFPGSPGSFKWDGLYGSSSPLLSDKRSTHTKEYEVALVGAFRREKDKDITLQALTSEVQAAMQLAKQREDEIKGLKMRLGFREAGIKRLEAVASGKISAEVHLLEEKEEHLKELEVLRAQVDRNQEVTRFAMENLRLKEEIRRLKSFNEEGERERMNEQIVTLQNKLLEALEWKLVNESDPSMVQKGNADLTTDGHSDVDLLAPSQDAGSPWHTPVNEENEFLRMQAIQNQSEIDSLHKKLSLCLEEKEKLERKINELVNELEAERSLKIQKEKIHTMQIVPPQSTDQIPNLYSNDQTEELEAMVDAIAAASNREAEAHEIAFKWSRENEQLRMKIKVLIDDNNKLIELYERAVSDNADKSSDANQVCQKSESGYQQNQFNELSAEKELVLKQEVENLEQQLTEMHEENDKLMELYEKAMQERDELMRKLSLEAQNIVVRQADFSCPEKLVEEDRGEFRKTPQSPCFQVEDLNFENLKLSDESDNVAYETDVPTLGEQERSDDLFQEDSHCHAAAEPDIQITSELESNSLNLPTANVTQLLHIVRMKLNEAEEKLSTPLETIGLFGTVKEAIVEVDVLSKEIETLEDAIKVKQHQYSSLENLSSEMDERTGVVESKLKALKYSLSRFSSADSYYEQRVVQAQTRLKASLSYLDRKKKEWACLETKKNGYMDGLRKLQVLETEIRNNMALLTTKLQEESQNEKVLFPIDNLEIADDPHVQRSMIMSGKATELLKFQEEKTKIQIEINQTRQKLETTRKENEDLNKKLRKVENEAQVVCMEIEKTSKSVADMECKLQDVSKDTEMLLEVKENWSIEIQNMIVEYYQQKFEAELKAREVEFLDVEMKMACNEVLKLRQAKLVACERKKQLLEVLRCGSCLEEIKDIRTSMMEMKSLLEDSI